MSDFSQLQPITPMENTGLDLQQLIISRTDKLFSNESPHVISACLDLIESCSCSWRDLQIGEWIFRFFHAIHNDAHGTHTMASQLVTAVEYRIYKSRWSTCMTELQSQWTEQTADIFSHLHDSNISAKNLILETFQQLSATIQKIDTVYWTLRQVMLYSKMSIIRKF